MWTLGPIPSIVCLVVVRVRSYWTTYPHIHLIKIQLGLWWSLVDNWVTQRPLRTLWEGLWSTESPELSFLHPLQLQTAASDRLQNRFLSQAPGNHCVGSSHLPSVPTICSLCPVPASSDKIDEWPAPRLPQSPTSSLSQALGTNSLLLQIFCISRRSHFLGAK